jgi:two-component system nitrogen regulation response regulator GlnG
MRLENENTNGKKNVVIGTMDFAVIQALGRRFTSTQYDVRFIQKGVDIITEILDHDIDMLILDLELAGIMGAELLPVVRKLRPRLPIILITDDYTGRIRQLAAEQGITFQAFKPMSDSNTDAILTATEKTIERALELQTAPAV